MVTWSLKQKKFGKHISPRHHGQVNIMKKYSVYYNNNVECNKVAEFTTLDEAKAYCTWKTKGYDEVCAGDNCYEGRSNNFRYEVYEGDSCFVLDEDGDVAEFKNAVYETEQFYCN